MQITRREFMKLLAVAAGGSALAFAPEAGEKAFQEVWGEDWVEMPRGVEKWVTSTCRQCPGGCGIRVRLMGHRPTKIEGNPLHPVNRGRLCPKGQAGLLSLNDPDRIKGPLKRAGERGSGKWQEIGWDEAVRLVVAQLKETRSKQAHTLAVMEGDASGLTKTLWEMFLRQFGSPNYMQVPAGVEEGPADAFYLMQGLKSGVLYDLEMAHYVLSFGSDLLQSFWSPLQVMRAFGYARRGKGLRARIIQVESRFSITAAKADEWLPINPGTEGALALGMAHFLIKEGLYDKNFVQEHTLGFEDWQDPSGAKHQGYKTLVMQNYPPSTVAGITGIPMESILRLAKEFATQGPALAVGTRGDIYQQMAVHSLNALVGNMDKPGGILAVKDNPALDLPAPPADETAKKGLKMPHIALPGGSEFPLADYALACFPGRELQGKPYALSTLFFHNCNPRFTHGHIQGFAEAMGKVPFIVSFSPYLDETAQYSDLILPDHTYLEKWEEHASYSPQGFPVLSISKPVAAPLYNTRNTADVLLQIAQGLGNPLAQAFPWKDSQAVLVDRVKKLYGMNRGDIFAPEVEEAFLRELARRGWRAPAYKNFEELWQGVQEKGGWWDPVYSYEEWPRVFKTPSGKFEFYSQILKKHLENARGRNPLPGLKAAGVEARGDQLFMPHWEANLNASPARAEDYPFMLKVFQPLIFAGSLHANEPFLQDISSFYTLEKWSSWVEINPRTARKLGIHEGDGVWVESSSAKLKFRARLTPGAMPQVVSSPLGLGHEALGRWAKGIGQDLRRLLAYGAEPFTGEPLDHKTRVKVYKA